LTSHAKNTAGDGPEPGNLRRESALPDPEAVRAAVPDFRPGDLWPPHGPADAYARYYGLDAGRRIAGVRHGGGWIQAAGYRILLQVLQPVAARGTVFIVHGYLEHSGLYPQLLPLLLKAGYAVVIHDLPGHGLSSGTRAGIRDFAEYQQVLTAVQQAAGGMPGPWLGLGQSTGGAILMEQVLAACAGGRVPVFDRLFLLAPLVLPTRLQWWQIRGLFWLFGALRSSTPRSFRRNTGDEAFLHFIRYEDPLQARWIPYGWVMALKEWVGRVHRYPPSRFPVWVVQGGRDSTVNGPYNLQFVRSRFKVCASLNLAGASHQLANEHDGVRRPVEHLLSAFLAG
jgi:alpha-beta hydrolase superfamily lysophospholipase